MYRSPLHTLTAMLAATALLAGCERAAPASKTETPRKASMSIYEVESKTLEGKSGALAPYRGKVALLVNVASECGYTPQYTGLQKLYEQLEPQGFVVLGFPSNDFGQQEPGSPETIRAFCSSKYRVTFPMFEKVVTKAGPDQSPVYAALSRATGSLPQWNFGKYLIDRSGKPLKFFPSNVEPDDPGLLKAIEAALAAGS